MTQSYTGLAYRAINPVYASDPLSGKGAALYGGRFNAKGMSALYLSLSIQTAILEINQVGTLQPTTLVSYEADVHNIFDATDPLALEEQNITSAQLSANTWRVEMREQGQSATQRFAARLFKNGFSGLKTPSYAAGTTSQNINLVLWAWNDGTNTLRVIDDENRL